MPARKLIKPLRQVLEGMVLRLAFENEKVLTDSDRTILDAIRKEMGEGKDFDLRITMIDGKAVVKCNEIQYKLDDPKTT